MEFSAYGPSHWGAVAVFVAGAVVLVWLGRRQTDAQACRFGRILGALTAVIYGAVLCYSLIPPDVGRSVPLQLTDLATVTAAYALWSQRQWAFALVYYWGLVLSAQALISPALQGPDFPHLQFLGFWAIHLLVVWAAIYLTWGRGMRPTWRSYRLVVVVTAAWAAVTLTFNSIADTNYGFLNGKPATASLLDLMGPWPVYVIVGAALVFAVWALMTWPWERARKHGRPRALCRLLLAAAIIVALSADEIGWARADSNALWTIVHDECVPHEQQNGDPAPCARVDLSGGENDGYAVLKDLVGARQFLLIPTTRITGIESPEVLEPDATNYFAAAWRARSYLEERAGRTLPRDWVSLAINSVLARSQNQLHIHIDCLRADVHEELIRHATDIGPSWTPFPVLLAGDSYSAIALAGDDLGAVNPFDLLADGIEGARADMGLHTLVVAGAVGSDGQPGFIILAGRANPTAGDLAEGEQVQDHNSCRVPTAGK